MPPRGALPEDRASSAPTSKGSLTLWLFVAGGFLLLGLAWTVLFTAARWANVETVPLVTHGGRP